MAISDSLRPASGQIPTTPGVYRFRDADGRVIYVGKAKSLRSRLNSYFQDPSALHPRTRAMVAGAARVEWTITATEVEALALEYEWIKIHEPRFNIKYRDDKSYPFLVVTLGEDIPRAHVTRSAKRPGSKAFGPYTHAWAIRETLDLLLRVFPVRTCSPSVFRRTKAQGRACLFYDIGKCSAPCVGKITPGAHRKLVNELCAFMAGDPARYQADLEAEMRQASADLDFEKAARLRDDAAALAKVGERNAVVLPDATDADVFGLAQDDLEAAVHVFFVRGGRVRGQRGWIVEKVEDVTDGQLVERLLTSVYGPEDADIPREILLPATPDNLAQAAAWLRVRRGAKVELRVPLRGEKAALAATVQENAAQALALHKTQRSTDLTSRSLALREIQDALGMSEAPLRIECYDISTTQGTHQSASMVVFEDGLARKSEYRRFAVQSTSDDTAALHEVLTRRFARLTQPTTDDDGLDSTSAIVRGKGGEVPRFAYRPQLVLVDGGAPQVAAAWAAMREAGVEGIALAGLAKRLEEVWLANNPYPVILPRASEGLYLLQRLRDEAHRVAITYHRSRRSKAMTAGSALDSIPGFGPVKLASLIEHFGSVPKAARATVEEITEVRGFGPAMARAVWEALQPKAANPGRLER
ncbi:MAG: excinuclease ABC subunit UvrC [Micrococcales bacterium]|nr:excinuclease ABC subunit UvrC [Micrococcales bacterium]